MTVGDRIRQLRKSHSSKMTQEQFGEKIGLKRDVITSYELNRVDPPETAVRLICREFGVSYAWLKDGIGEMEEVPSDIQTLDAIGRLLDGENEFAKFVFRKAAKLDKTVWDSIEAELKEYFDAEK